MNSSDIYGNIAERTQGCIYAGVVGPVRTGKSTFIKRFMDLMVLPNVDNLYVRQRVLDELPQSGSGKTITTTEPKFVPAEAVTLTLPHNVSFKVRMVDCVGYLVPGAMGHEEEGKARMVRTPWSDEEMTFAEAAETGTRKVITDHSTIGIAVTTDGTIGDLKREAYIEAGGQNHTGIKGTRQALCGNRKFHRAGQQIYRRPCKSYERKAQGSCYGCRLYEDEQGNS